MDLVWVVVACNVNWDQWRITMSISLLIVLSTFIHAVKQYIARSIHIDVLCVCVFFFSPHRKHISIAYRVSENFSGDFYSCE